MNKQIVPGLKYKLKPLLYILISLLIFSCNKSREKPSPHVVEHSVIKIAESSQNKLLICYQVDSINTWAQRDSLKNHFSKDQLKIIYALNRIDESRVGPGTQLVIPDTLMPDLMAYSPFPTRLAILKNIPKTILIAQRIQGLALYENGKLIKWGPVSAGKQSTPTPNGLHYGNYKSREKVSTVNKDWLLPYYFNFMNRFGVGVHQYLLPGYPASHACVRLRMEDAEFIYYWANQWVLGNGGKQLVKNGTPFMVFGKYDYSKPAPWKQLLEDNENNKLTTAELDTLKSYAEEFNNDTRNFAETENLNNELAQK